MAGRSRASSLDSAPLFEAVGVIEAGIDLEPSVLLQYSSPNSTTVQSPSVRCMTTGGSQVVDDTIAAFCFPDSHELAKYRSCTPSAADECRCSDPSAGVVQLKHTFVLTESDAQRKLGCCVRFPHKRGKRASTMGH